MLLDDLADYLTSAGSFTTGDLFVGTQPAAPDTAVTLREGPGLPTVHAFNAAAGQAKVEQPRVQVVSRSASYPTARANAQAAFALLDGLPTRSINGAAYFWAEALQSPYLMGRDGQGRVEVVFNVQVYRAMSTSTST